MSKLTHFTNSLKWNWKKSYRATCKPSMKWRFSEVDSFLKKIILILIFSTNHYSDLQSQCGLQYTRQQSRNRSSLSERRSLVEIVRRCIAIWNNLWDHSNNTITKNIPCLVHRSATIITSSIMASRIDSRVTGLKQFQFPTKKCWLLPGRFRWSHSSESRWNWRES